MLLLKCRPFIRCGVAGQIADEYVDGGALLAAATDAEVEVGVELAIGDFVWNCFKLCIDGETRVEYVWALLR